MLGVSRNKVIVYINGVLIDPISVSVTSTRNALSNFTIDVPGIPEWDILPARSPVAVFYADDVSNKWRLLVEGEYIAYNKVKTASGQRSVSLRCRSLHGCFEHATNLSVGSLACQPNTTDTARQLELIANGRVIAPTGTNTLDVPTTAGLLALAAKGSATVSVFFPELVRYVLSQMPVEAYYLYERRLAEKMFSLFDVEIQQTIDVRRLNILAENIRQQGYDDGATLMALLNRYESMFMYQHIPVLAPPIYGKSKDIDSAAQRIRNTGAPGVSDARIPELLFTPYLYDVIPPACNVIFQDQIQVLNRGEDFSATPTRVITTLTTAVGQNSPKVHMANNVTGSFDAATDLVAAYPGNNPGRGASHCVLSGDEMNRGVIAHPISIPLETVLGNNAAPETSWENFFSQATRHYFSVVTGEYKTAQLTCVYLPMLVPGVTCLVEDLTGPFHGYIESVTHILSNDSAPQTVVDISHVRPAIIRDGVNMTPPLPIWLNAAFRPAGIGGTAISTATNTIDTNGTWAQLFGVNAVDLVGGGKPHAAMVPESTITVGILDSVKMPGGVRSDSDPNAYTEQHVDMDKLASKVVPVYTFDKDAQFKGISENTIADTLRKSADPNLAMRAYNWRPGVSLSQYVNFHALAVTGLGEAIDAVNSETGGQPPETLFNVSDLNKDGTPFFSAPIRAVFQGTYGIDKKTLEVTTNGADHYGAYKLDTVNGKRYNPTRQLSMLTIKDAINRRITKS